MSRLPPLRILYTTTTPIARARRANRYPTRVLESILDGTTLISTTGERAGQINGLVVIELAGELFGHPVRITATFGVLMSLEPAVAALAGFVLLHQPLAPLQVAGVAVVVGASALASVPEGWVRRPVAAPAA